MPAPKKSEFTATNWLAKEVLHLTSILLCSFLQAMNGADSGSDCEVIEKLPPDQEFFAKKTESELADLERHRVDFDELEERLYKCTVCQKQVNHKQRVKRVAILFLAQDFHCFCLSGASCQAPDIGSPGL